MSNDNLKALEEAGISLDRISEDQREVLETLSPEELAVLINVHKQVDATREVVGQSADDLVVGNAVF